MLRESSVPYSSLPQEEGGQTFVNTRTTNEPTTYSKNRLVSITAVLLLICGVPLMIIAPLALSRGNARTEASMTFPNTEGQNSGIDALNKNNESELINLATPTSHIAIPIPVINNTTLKPPAPVTTTKPTTTKKTPTTTTTTTTTPTTTTTTTTTSTTTTTTTTTTPAPATTHPIVIIPPASVLKPSEEVPIAGLGKNQTGAATGSTKTPESQKGSEGGSGGGSPEDGDYYDISSTSTQSISNLMNNFMTKHEWWTVVGLAVVTALAMAAVISTIAWIIRNRLSSRRRKNNLQQVITDLQSRDKVILLNSEDSEDEA